MLEAFRKSIQYCKSEKIHIVVIIVLRMLVIIISLIQPLLYANMITCLLKKQVRELSIFIYSSA